MAAAVTIPVEQYLRTSYRPDCDYVDGEVRERNLGERWHSSVQAMITIIFGQHRREWGLIPVPEHRGAGNGESLPGAGYVCCRRK